MTAGSSLIPASLSAVAAFLAVYVAAINFRGQLFELARKMHVDLTTGEVAAARDVLGRIRHDPRHALDPDNVGEARAAWFCLLWCFQRLNAGRRRIGRARWLGRGPRRFFDELVQSQLEFLNSDLTTVRQRIAAVDPGLSDDDSKMASAELIRAVLGVPPGEWARPGTRPPPDSRPELP